MNDDELKKLRAKYATMGLTELVAIIDEALSRGAERDEAKRREGDANEHLDHCVVARRERDEARAALANARAVALEEAARWVDKRNVLLSADAARVYEDAEEHRAWTAAKIRALSSSPPSGQWVAADVMERVKAAKATAPGLDNLLLLLQQGKVANCACCDDYECRWCAGIITLRAALSALESEASQ